ncbi:MAG TPA: proton-conducting transporter membrane subunit [Acetobacteraceae bacterium]|nr:proton-conducting transporter membrane subunit [Acetobacteraceae bacterium]
MNAPLLAFLVAAIAALLGLGALAAVWPRRASLIVWSAAGVAGFAAAIALLDLLLAMPPATAALPLVLPLGLPGVPLRLALDPLAAFFAALVFGTGSATLAFIAATEEFPAATAVPICVGMLGIAVLGENGFAEGLGLALAGTALWMSGSADRSGAAQFGLALLAAAAVVAAGAILPRAGLWTALIGPGALAGLLPLHRWTAPAHGASTPTAALLSGAIVPTALFVMLRLLLSPNGTVPPAWWGVTLSLAGAAAAVIGGLDAAQAPDLDSALAAGTMRQTGLATLGIGVALTAVGEDLPAVATMALAAVLVLAVLQAIAGTLLALACGAIREGAGTRRLDRLGGLVRRMPVTTVCLLAGLTGLAAVPASAGFAVAWLLLHAFLGLPHAGTLPAQLWRCALVAAVGLASALSIAAALRLVGVACLGRPRTPRCAVADEPSRGGRLVLVTLALATTAWGVLVGPLLIVFADAPMRVLTGAGLGPLATPLGLAGGVESPGYAALPIACLLALIGGLVIWLRRLLGVPAAAAGGPAWEDGFAAPPGWLPFGDPTTQTAGADFAPSFHRCGASWPGRDSEIDRPNHTVPATGDWRTIVGSLRELASKGVNLRPLPAGSAPAIVLILLAGLLILCAWAGVS